MTEADELAMLRRRVIELENTNRALREMNEDRTAAADRWRKRAEELEAAPRQRPQTSAPQRKKVR